MTPALDALPQMFPSFGDFMLGTFTLKQAHDFCERHPGNTYYGVSKRDPATGELVLRWAVRETVVKPAASAVEPVKATQPKKVKAPGETRNGVTAPSATSVGAKIWAMCDDLWSIRKEPFTKSILLMTSVNRGFNEGNTLTECSRWRKFHGMTWKL